ncbi:MAG: hypothetical protein PVH88_09700 [Ignavibacteria bacterium]|jgi:hypothetical protein
MNGLEKLTSLRDTKSSIRLGSIRSIPKVQRSSYLELFVMSGEKQRLEKELFTLEKRRNTIKKRLTEVYKKMEILQKEINKSNITSKSQSTKEFKTITFNY